LIPLLQILGWLEERDVKSTIVIGHSLGGYVALAMAALDEEFCKKLALFHSTVYADSDEKKANRDKVIGFVTQNGVAPFIQTFVPSLFFN
jgi:pimeloyl-ACP methyl ester carboxylesterase